MQCTRSGEGPCMKSFRAHSWPVSRSSTRLQFRSPCVVLCIHSLWLALWNVSIFWQGQSGLTLTLYISSHVQWSQKSDFGPKLSNINFALSAATISECYPELSDDWQMYTFIRMYLCTYIHTYLHTYERTYIHIYVYTYVYMNIHTYIHNTYILTYVWTYIHIYVYTYIYMNVHTYIHTYICIYLHIYERTYVYIHTYILIYLHTYERTYIHIYVYTYIYMNVHTCTYIQR